jgi:precorrin-2 dehydrogenase/sirohydrochlorin ferrochelatase
MPAKLYLPINLILKDKKCLVAGGGQVAQRKIRCLKESGAKIFAVAKEATSGIKTLALKKKIHLVRRNFVSLDLKDKMLVIAATNNRKLNRDIAKLCRKRRILVNVVDSLVDSDFIFPAYFRQGALVIAVSTGGKSPAFAQRIRNDLKKSFGKEYKACLNQISGLRQKIIKLLPDTRVRKKILKKLVNF